VRRKKNRDNLRPVLEEPISCKYLIKLNMAPGRVEKDEQRKGGEKVRKEGIVKVQGKKGEIGARRSGKKRAGTRLCRIPSDLLKNSRKRGS